MIDPSTILQKHHSHLQSGTLAGIWRLQHSGGFSTGANSPGLGSSTSSGSKTSTAVGESGIYQQEGEEVHENLKDMKAIHEFPWLLRA